MFSDTHFHFHLIAERAAQEPEAMQPTEILSAMAEQDCFFGLDIGTKADDLAGRLTLADSAIAHIKNPEARQKAQDLLYFSAGIWPAVEDIKARTERVATLKNQIDAAMQADNPLFRKIIAVGECGLDRHWNKNSADGRSETDFDAVLCAAERELFEMQLELARSMQLPVIVHSRDAFQETLECIENVGYDNGIIHCYSYGAAEAAAFLERGWYISFSGAITYTKKSKLAQTEELVQLVPADKILCETDAPYLAPTPFRGQSNTPLLVQHTYDFVAKMRGIETEALSAAVDANIRALFKI